VENVLARFVSDLAGDGQSNRAKGWRIRERAWVIRYPNGDYEHGFSGQSPPVIGDTMRRKGEDWRVTRLWKTVS